MSPYDGVKFSKDGSKCKMKRTPIKKKAIDKDIAEDMFCSATLLIERMVQDDEFDMVGSENDDNNGRVWTTLSTFLNPLCPEILC